MAANANASASALGVNHLRTSRYDQVASLLLSLLLLIGLAVLVLLIVWLTSRIFVGQTAVPVEMADFAGDDGPVGGGQTPDSPNPEEIRELEIEEPILTETLSEVASIVKTIPQLDDPLIAKRSTSTGGFGTGEGRGRGSGKGDGSGGAQRRWEMHFPKGATLEQYARQLDFFRIELGVILPDGRVAYAYNLSKRKPDVRYGGAEKENRYYLTWRSGNLQEADRELLARAGLNANERIILKFLPPEVEAQLAALEKAHAGGNAKSVRKTRFGIQPSGNGYAFFVMEQTYNR